jgi:hypothetical protein
LAGRERATAELSRAAAFMAHAVCSTLAHVGDCSWVAGEIDGIAKGRDTHSKNAMQRCTLHVQPSHSV